MLIKKNEKNMEEKNNFKNRIFEVTNYEKQKKNLDVFFIIDTVNAVNHYRVPEKGNAF